MKDSAINQAYELAKERYASIGIDTEKVLSHLQEIGRASCRERV